MIGLNKTTMIGLSVVALGILGNVLYKKYSTSNTVKLAQLSEQTDSLMLEKYQLSAEKMTDTAIISLSDSYLPPNMRKDAAPAPEPPKEKETKVATIEKIEKVEIKPAIVAIINSPAVKKVDKPSMVVAAERPVREKVDKPLATPVAEKETVPTATESSEAVASKNVDESKFYVVIGSYQSEENAQLELKKAPTKQLSVLKDGKYFRVISGRFTDKKEANDAAKSLNTEGVPCFVIQR
jgi:septal ring-binding cell division protein DamX